MTTSFLVQTVDVQGETVDVQGVSSAFQLFRGVRVFAPGHVQCLD
jgi:hypothetical protein